MVCDFVVHRIREDGERFPLLRFALAYFCHMEYNRRMTKTAAELLGDVDHYLALGQANYARAHAALAEYERALGMQKSRKVPTIKSLRIWGEWLTANGPATRAYITGETGTRLTERATPHTVEWTDQIDPNDELSYPADTIMRIRGASEGPGRGAPPVIYFLWSQRFDVLPLFGVGPKQDPGTLLGVVRPPKDPQQAEDTAFIPRIPIITVTGNPAVDNWLATHHDVFKQIQLGSKPDAEQRLKLRSDAPEGVDVNIAIALASSGRLSELTA